MSRSYIVLALAITLGALMFVTGYLFGNEHGHKEFKKQAESELAICYTRVLETEVEASQYKEELDELRLRDLLIH